ncbi:uncharacterized protein LOC143040035 [Oratosquilla oratoria]|uniref:uncharacterized protein LOC143040035 n=1 Tax=Oratosquilla oratoria TaxID=337810 RepID=UPI003F762A57
MDPGNNVDVELFTALLANIHSLPQGAYDVDDDDDDDEYDDDDEDDDDDYDYGGAEHSIHAMANPYGGDGAGGHGDMGHVALPTMQTMSILQGLLGNASMPDMAATMGGGMGGMGAPMDGGAGGIFPNMPSFLPNMSQDITGALAGAFAGGMNALMDEYQSATGGAHDAEDDFDDEDDDLLSDEEDDDDDEVLHGGHGMSSTAAVAAAAAAAAAGGMMAGALMNGGGHHPTVDADYLGAPQHLMIGGPPQRQPSPMVDHPTSGHLALPSTVTPSPMATSMSGGTVSRMDPLSAMTLGAAGVAAGAGILGPVVSGLLSAVGGKNASADGGGNLLLSPNARPGATITELPSEAVLDRNTPLGRERPMLGRDTPVDPAVADVAKTLEKTKLDPNDPKATPSAPAPAPAAPPAEAPSEKEAPKAAPKPATEPVEKPDEKSEKSPSEAENKEPRVPADGSAATTAAPKEDTEDDKTSLGSETGDGKSDTESVRKKTPSPVLTKLGRLSPTGSESTPVLESASCASITDLASATESMRDSDTDNHSDAHNVTANLSDLDSELPAETQKVRPAPIPVQPQQQQQQQFAVGALPIVVEKPTFGWQTMVGLDTAKEALTTLFKAAAFPEVFEGTQGICKGILLFGPSGSGKTCLARALAKEVNDAMLIGISTGFLVSQHPLEASNIVRCLFDHARRYRPAVILFDEVDTLSFSSTSEAALRAKAELQAQVRGQTTLSPPYMAAGGDPSTFNEGLMVVGTTNLPWVLEDDVRRLFAYNVHIKLPGEKAREELFRTYMQNLPHALTDEQFKCLVAKTEGYSAADIHTVIRHAAHMPPSENTYIPNSPNALTYEALVAVILQYRCRYDENLSQKYQAYIKAATHRSEDRQEEGGDKRKDREKAKGVKKIGRLAKSLAAALVAVID